LIESALNDDHLILNMTEKQEEITSPSSSTSAFPTVLDPPKPPMVNDPVDRPLLTATPTQPTIEEQQPPAKEGYNYWNHLPYEVEDEDTRIAHLNDIIRDLYTCVRAGDFEGGARTASRQIKRWLHLKFKMPKDTRKKLIKLYYELALTPGIDPSAADTFANMFKLLASYEPLVSELIIDLGR
jgi:Proteasome-substrate-size regulator, N-terminal